MSVDDNLQKAVALHQAGKLQEAEQIYLNVLAQNPDHPDATHFMGVLAYNAGKNDVAIAYLKRAIELMPSNAGCFNNMGNVFQHQGKYSEAVKWYEIAVRLNPEHKLAHNNIGVAYLKLGKLDIALDAIEKAIALDPGYADAHCNYGEVLRAMGAHDRALDAFNKALAIVPELVMARWNRALIWLAQGNFADGWAEYEWRWRRPETRKRSFACGTVWQGQDIRDKVLFVYEEQGLGDTMQFIRYLPKLKDLGARVVFETGPALIRLVEGNRLYDRLLVGLKGVDTRPVDRFDFHVPLLSLPRILKTTIDTIPAKVPYLTADKTLCNIWKSRVPADDSFKIGLVWAGHPEHNNDHNRSIHLCMFKELGKVKGVSLYSLQKDKHERWTDTSSLSIFEKDFGPEISDFSDTAAILDNLDLLISVDTSVVHLAGAMGKPVWTLLPFAPDFRWLLFREDSPWYPSMRLFRQPVAGDWNSVFKRVVQALNEEVSRRQGDNKNE